MTSRITGLPRIIALAALLPCVAHAQQAARPAAPATITVKTAGMQQLPGFMPLYIDHQAGKVWLEIARFNEELLYYVSLPAGVGHNDIGLNRGDLGPQYVVHFERVGPKVLMVQPNYEFRADTKDAAERKAVTDAFATSVIWGFKVEAEENGRVLVDATDFFLRDAHGVANTLRRGNQGTYRVDATRSALYAARTKAFPKNTEVEATITLVGETPGGLVRSVTPTPEALTVREHHSFVELPSGYTPREADPRAGYFGISYLDYATPLGQPLTKRFIARHRLQKQDPSAAVSDPVQPIVYYLDPGTPEPIRSALLEGGRWWNQAFEAAGFRNAFRMAMLPDSADPMDLRYNIVQWVHRSTRGWSYGNTVTDPRTGEILKGHVTLGSLRVRQDYLIAEGLLQPYEKGSEEATAARDMALARLRQLSAHEIGHTLGLAHNYIASTQRAAGAQSVMDYPHPVALLTADGRIDLSQAYETGIGEWDKVAIAYGYQDYPPGVDERQAGEGLLAAAGSRGITFISDADARPAGSAHPAVHLWDNGSDVTAELERMLTVRRAALERFGEHAIKTGAPLATIEEALVPLYLHHRYQTEAAVKSIAGAYYTYALRGDRQRPLQRVPAERQNQALAVVLRTVSPQTLALPQSVLATIPPRPFGYSMHSELFERWTGITFDAVSPAAAAAELTLTLLLNAERAARLVEQHALDVSLPGLDAVLEQTQRALLHPDTRNEYEQEIGRAVQRVYVDRLMDLAVRATMPQVRAIAAYELDQVRREVSGAGRTVPETAHRWSLAQDIARFQERPLPPLQPGPLPDAPPGQPIGQPDMNWLEWIY